MTDGLKDQHREAIIDILSANDRVERAVLFGSRAMETFTTTSDVDIALFGHKLSLDDQAKLAEAIAGLPMPQRVDLLLHHRIVNKKLRGHIARHGVEWYRRKGPSSTSSATAPGRTSAMAREWTLRTFGELCEHSAFGPRFGGEMYAADGNVATLRTTDISADGRIEYQTMPLANLDLARLEQHILRAGDLVITRTGRVGSAAVFGEFRLPVLPGAFLIRFRLNRSIAIPAYFRYYFMSPLGQQQIESVATGSVQKNLNITNLHRLSIHLPPLKQQQAIACILGALDDKIELNRRRNRTLEATARAIFKRWFVDFDPVRAKAAVRRGHPGWTDKQASRAACPGLKPDLAVLFPDAFEDSDLGEIPKGWRVETLGDMSEKPQYGYTASASDEPIGPRFLRITDINKQEWIEWHNVPYCPIEPREQSKYILERGDVVIARMADPGHGALVEEDVDAVFASYLIRFRPRQRELGRFLQYWLRSDSYWNLVRSRQSGTTRANLNAQVLRSFTLVVPKTRVLEAFSRQIDALRDKLVTNVGVSRTLAMLRDAMLPKLISGELRVPDAERIVGRCA